MNNFKYFLEACSLLKICKIVLEYTLNCSQLISFSDNKKILLTTRTVWLDSGCHATKKYLRTYIFRNLGNTQINHIDLHLIFEKPSLKSWTILIFLSFSNLIACVSCKIQVQNRRKINFVQLDFSNSIFQKSSADQ